MGFDREESGEGGELTDAKNGSGDDMVRRRGARQMAAALVCFAAVLCAF